MTKEDLEIKNVHEEKVLHVITTDSNENYRYTHILTNVKPLNSIQFPPKFAHYTFKRILQRIRILKRKKKEENTNF